VDRVRGKGRKGVKLILDDQHQTTKETISRIQMNIHGETPYDESQWAFQISSLAEVELRIPCYSSVRIETPLLHLVGINKAIYTCALR